MPDVRMAATMRYLTLVVCFGALSIFAALMFVMVPPVRGCERYEPNPPHEPTGIKGCEVYGEGIASRWPGPGVARNDCVWPWDDCTPIVVTSLDTGQSITVTPTMYCDCYTGTADQRLVDLDPAAVSALGLDWSRGLYRVSVEPATMMPMLPDTAMR